jgi:hypothetical protein
MAVDSTSGPRTDLITMFSATSVHVAENLAFRPDDYDPKNKGVGLRCRTMAVALIPTHIHHIWVEIDPWRW